MTDHPVAADLYFILVVTHAGDESFCGSGTLKQFLVTSLSYDLRLSLLVCAPMGSPSRGGGVSRLSLPAPFSPIFVCPSAYRNLSPVLLFTHQLLPTYLQFSSSDCPFCLHRPFTYISLLYKPSSLLVCYYEIDSVVCDCGGTFEGAVL